MPSVDFLHRHSEFSDLLRSVATQMAIDPALVEKDYWIMHCLYGLQCLNLSFELKGGTSLSKGYGLIERFSEDIDIRIDPPASMDVKIGKNQDKPSHRESRRLFYDWLAETIKIDGIESVERDETFDDIPKFRNGGIRLRYKTATDLLTSLKEGILLEVGFDDVTPNAPKDISSWAYDFAIGEISVADNRAKGVLCYHPGYTLVEKLQTVSTKYRKQQAEGSRPVNVMRHYYDVYCLLEDQAVLSFIGTPDYCAHKGNRFPSADNKIIAQNEAFLLSDAATRLEYEKAYQATRAIYYKGQPAFSNILERIHAHIDRL